MVQAPPIPKELLEFLEKQFPSRSLTKQDLKKSEQEIWFEAGKVSLVEYLRSQFEYQNENLTIQGMS